MGKRDSSLSSASQTRDAVSFCRICSGGCGVILTVDEQDRILAVRGDKDNPLTRGYACFKGRQPEASHHGSQRLLKPLKRMDDGTYREISSEQALDEIAARLAPLIERHGSETLAVYLGNGGMFNIAGFYMLPSFLSAFGSDQYFSTLTINPSRAGGIPRFVRIGTVAPSHCRPQRRYSCQHAAT
jgi:anaerobic selenocysteine-containing dehydrogenase